MVRGSYFEGSIFWVLKYRYSEDIVRKDVMPRLTSLLLSRNRGTEHITCIHFQAMTKPIVHRRILAGHQTSCTYSNETLGRTASGGALAPLPPRATVIGTEFPRVFLAVFLLFCGI